MTALQLATPGDAEAIAAFANGSFTHTFGHIYDAADLATFLADWNPPDRVRAQLANPGYAIALVRDTAGAILGYIKMGPVDFDLPAEQPTDSAVELHQLYVAEAAKGTGVAAALMDWGIAWARARASILYLTVFTENDRAQAFYRRYGFYDVGRNEFRVGNHVDEDRFFRLDL
ncbi:MULTISPECIES: GNAT family N-acetyltransferase [unclassified Sphingopyxis]|uniref:GNAT family N-acetyltransferase n=1 Tax=unclassified Sphingopyxis TaxID=2614943 RepID=UPI0028566A0B|nr:MULTISPECIES: GNAT family N-acetyltransferase [unclassified Sphingopyxis]MDR6834531.1 ribosomal protein S18 acetylase RimI-like enzyme [Sphingopyxis sp. BE122]MDR7226801.1 ribosomal protein S18 acetylase RimI-like enzyme [Sphingopyxis sp. BE259]